MIIAYDLGTSGVKASLVSEDCSIIKSTFRSYPTLCSPDGKREQRPLDWWNAIKDCTVELLQGEKSSNVNAICLSGHSMGIAPLDKNGELLCDTMPIWSDDRGTPQSERFFKEISYDVWYADTGCGSPAGLYPLFKIMNCKEHTPELYRDTACFIGTKDYINFRLCKNIASDISYASGTGIMSALRYEYNQDYLNAAGVDISKLPRICDSTDIVGYMTKESADELGLVSGIPIVCGGVDNACMALGAGCIRENDMYASLGTSAWVSTTLTSPMTIPGAYTFAHAIRGLYLTHLGIFSSGSSHSWTLNNIFPYLDQKTRYAEFEKLAKASVTGAKGVIFAPAFAGGSLADPSPNIRGSFVNLDLAHTTADLAQATLEGISMHLKYAADKLFERGAVPKELILTGGGAKSDYWTQIYADVFDLPMSRSSVMQNTATLGAAVIGMVGAGIHKSFDCIENALKGKEILYPVKENAEFYKKRLVAFSYLLRAQAEIYSLT